MATLKQQKLAKEIVQTFAAKETITAGQMLENVGYKKSVAKHKPKEILEGDGVLEELAALGFNAENAKNVVATILNKEYAEDKDRLKAAEIIFKVTGDFAPEKHLVVTKKIISVDE